ncbi:MAG: hypothetical protein JF604_25510, partial [Bradyrhizobium sp.]|nr:hypothetical protein [Bradyrhizobium sp.]
MARYDHLELVRLPEQFERRKHGGGGPPPARDRDQHTTKLRDELDATTQEQRGRRKPEFVDPSLILRVQMTGTLLEEEWERLGLTVLSSDVDRTLVLLTSSEGMQDFRARLDAYQSGPPLGQKHAPYINFISGIESIGSVEPRDRIGPRLLEEGFADVDDFVAQTSYLVDIELWDLGERRLRERKIEDVIRYVEARGGDVFDRYLGPSISMFRARLTGELLRTLLTVEEIAAIDLPPAPDVTTAEALDMVLADAPPLNAVADDRHHRQRSQRSPIPDGYSCGFDRRSRRSRHRRRLGSWHPRGRRRRVRRSS